MPLSPHVPELGALQLFLDVVATGSIGAAGRRHGVSQQAASARLRSLERQVGVAVLDRRARGTGLTDAGTAFAAWAARVVEAATDLDAGLTALRHRGSARLRLAASMTVAEHLVPGWLAALRAHGGVEQITLTATNSAAVADLVRAGAVDVGLVEGPDPLADLSQVVVGTDDLVLVVAPDHPWARRRRPVAAALLARTPLVTREVGSGTRTALEQALGPPGPTPVLELSTATAVRESVRAGLGPAVLPRLAVAGDLRDGRLVAIGVTGVDLRRRLRAVWVGPTDRPPAGPARDLVATATARVRPPEPRRRGAAGGVADAERQDHR